MAGVAIRSGCRVRGGLDGRAAPAHAVAEGRRTSGATVNIPRKARLFMLIQEDNDRILPHEARTGAAHRADGPPVPASPDRGRAGAGRQLAGV